MRLTVPTSHAQKDSTDRRHPGESSHPRSPDSIRAANGGDEATSWDPDADRAEIETVQADLSGTPSAVCSQSHGRPGKRGSLPASLRACQCTVFRPFASDPSDDGRSHERRRITRDSAPHPHARVTLPTETSVVKMIPPHAVGRRATRPYPGKPKTFGLAPG